MIFFFATQGRLGNQLFHLAALDKLCASREIGVLFGSAVLRENFHFRRRNIFIARGRPEFLFRVTRKLAHHRLASHRIEGRLGTPHGIIENGELVTLRKSRVPLTLVENAWLQSDAWMRDDFPRALEFPRPVLDEVARFGADNAINWETSIFVHVRRGDYAEIDVLGAGAPVLPASYYREGIRRLKEKLPVSHVVFATDDAANVRATFPDVPGKVIVSRSPVFDLCVMSRCASGVLSPSSFSWWGAMLGPLRAPPVAPQFWLGWRRNITFPSQILSSRFDVLPVPADEGR